MAYNGKPYWNGWNIGVPLFSETPICSTDIMGGVDSGVFFASDGNPVPDLRHGVDGSGARVTMSFQLWQRQDPGRHGGPVEKQQKTQQKRPKTGEIKRCIELLNLRCLEIVMGRICGSDKVTLKHTWIDIMLFLYCIKEGLRRNGSSNECKHPRESMLTTQSCQISLWFAQSVHNNHHHQRLTVSRFRHFFGFLFLTPPPQKRKTRLIGHLSPWPTSSNQN